MRYSYLFVLLPLPLLVASPVYAQSGDTTNLWGQLTLDVCIATYETGSNEYLGITKCDHDLLYMKGICKKVKQYEYCTDPRLDMTLEERGLTDAPIPEKQYCKTYVKQCQEIDNAINRWISHRN